MTNFDALKQIYEALGGGGLVVHGADVGNKYVLDKTWQEIYEAASSGRSVVLASTEPNGVVYLVDCQGPAFSGDSYMVAFAYANELGELECGKYVCAEATGYPSVTYD